MIRQVLTARARVIALALVVGLVITALWLSGLRLRPQTAVAEELATTAFHTCTPAEVATFDVRIHVRCTVAASGGIVYFAYPTRDTAGAARYLSVLSTALVANKQVVIMYDTADTSGVAYGCLAADCRPMRGVGLYR